MMTLSTLDPNPQKNLTDRTSQHLRILVNFIKRSWTFGKRVALRRDDFACKLVVWRIVMKLITKPSRHCHSALWFHDRFVHTQDVCPFHCPKVGILGAFQKLVNQLLPFAWRRVGDEPPDLIGSRQAANRVKMDTAQECRIVGQLTRLNAELLEFVPDCLIDEIILLWPPECF